MAGLYIHIPFCKRRCIYCGFFSTTSLSQRQRYVDALCKEMVLREKERNNQTVKKQVLDTIYLGGGTPSQLSAQQLSMLFGMINRVYDVSPDAEITMECNPEDVTPSFVAHLSQLPVNRVSMGAQTFGDERLSFLHRRHCAAQVSVAVKRLREAGIANVSIDLMYGFPSETLEEWHADIDAALSLDVQHLSAYALSYEEGTLLWKMLEKGEVEELDEELQRQMYYELIDRLEAAGYEHYEISNFALPGYRSRHNSNYWNHTPYIGLGAGAHSLSVSPLRRQWNIDQLDAYITSIEKGCLPSTAELLDEDTLYNEQIMIRLRTSEGLPLALLSSERRTYCLSQADKYIRNGWLVYCDNCLRLTRDGLFVSDMIFADLL